MPIYEFRCGCGVAFERLLPVGAGAPDCPACAGVPRKVPGGASLGGRAGAGRPVERMPQTWRALRGGDRETVTAARREWERRERLEARHPELGGDRRPVLAHEGRYHDSPLRAGDVPGAGPAPPPAAGVAAVAVPGLAVGIASGAVAGVAPAARVVPGVVPGVVAAGVVPGVVPGVPPLPPTPRHDHHLGTGHRGEHGSASTRGDHEARSGVGRNVTEDRPPAPAP